MNRKKSESMTDEQRESLSSFVEKSSQLQKHEHFENILSRNVLIAPTSEQFELLKKRLKQLLDEGRGEVILEVKHFHHFLH